MLEKTETMLKTAAFGTNAADEPLEPITIEWRQPSTCEVQKD